MNDKLIGNLLLNLLSVTVPICIVLNWIFNFNVPKYF